MWVAFNAWLRRVWLSHSCKLLQDTTLKNSDGFDCDGCERKPEEDVIQQAVNGRTVTMNDDNNNCEP